MGVLVAKAAADIANDDIAGINGQLSVAQADPVTRGALAGNGDVVVLDAQGRLQVDVAVHFENDDARSAGLHGFPEASGAMVIQVGHDHHPAAAAAGRVFAEALGAGECKGLCG